MHIVSESDIASMPTETSQLNPNHNSNHCIERACSEEVNSSQGKEC